MAFLILGHIFQFAAFLPSNSANRVRRAKMNPKMAVSQIFGVDSHLGYWNHSIWSLVLLKKTKIGQFIHVGTTKIKVNKLYLIPLPTVAS